MSDYTQAKAFLKKINDLKIKGLTKVKYIGLKKDAMIEKFMETVEAVDDLGKLDVLPEDLIDFYEGLVGEEEGEEEVEEVEDDEAEEAEEDEWEDLEDEGEEDELEEDEIEEDEPEEEEEDEPDFDEMSKKECLQWAKAQGIKVKPAIKKSIKKLRAFLEEKYDELLEEEEEDEPAPKPKKPAKKKAPKAKAPAEKKPRTIKATKRMSARIENNVLTLKYGDGKPKKIKVQKADKTKLKATIKKVVTWAKEQGATPGQIQAVKKAFTSKGYHVTR